MVDDSIADISDTIVAKSDQLNADNLVAGPITVQITRAVRAGGEQPIVIHLGGGHMPWKPCLTSRRILVALWGKDGRKWAGRWVRLHRDPRVKWAGAKVGGIRPTHLSHIEGPVTLALQISKGKKEQYNIAPLSPKDITEDSGQATADLDAFLDEQGLARADVDRWLASIQKPTLSEKPDDVPKLAAYLAGKPAEVEKIRKLRDAVEVAGE